MWQNPLTGPIAVSGLYGCAQWCACMANQKGTYKLGHNSDSCFATSAVNLPAQGAPTELMHQLLVPLIDMACPIGPFSTFGDSGADAIQSSCIVLLLGGAALYLCN
jgi:hypothetical protein